MRVIGPLPDLPPRLATRILWGLLAVAVATRLAQYLWNHSLWADEAALALNIIERGYAGLMRPLDYGQGAPIGFLWAERLAVDLFGPTEPALRLVPLLAALAALPMFWFFFRRHSDARTALVALAMIAGLYPFARYAAEVKQYSTDIAAMLGCYWVAERSVAGRQTWPAMLALGLGGAALIWLSHPAVFVLSGVVVAGLARANWRAIRHLERTGALDIARRISWLTYGIWALVFAASYVVSLRELAGREALAASWQDHGGFPSGWTDIVWLPRAFLYYFGKALQYRGIFVPICAAAFAIGCVSFYREDRGRFAMLLTPLLVTALAAILHLYPFAKRLVLFLSPIFLLIMAQGITTIWAGAQRWQHWAAAGMMLVLLGEPLVHSVLTLSGQNKKYHEQIRPVIAHIFDRLEPGDRIYVFQRGVHAFRYYAPRFGLTPGDYILGSDDLDQTTPPGLSPEEVVRYQADLEALRGAGRVWLLFSHAHQKDERAFFDAYLARFGPPIHSFDDFGTYTYLYDLPPLPREPGTGE